MKKMGLLVVLVVAGPMIILADYAEFNLAPKASGFGVMPGITLSQGTAAGIADGFCYTHWARGFSGGFFSSPTTGSGVNSNDVYMTWSSKQTVRSLMFLGDISTTYDEIRIYALNDGGDPTDFDDWTQIWYAQGLSSIQHQIIDLCDDYLTTGLRIYVHRNGGDARTAIGEIAVYGPLGKNGDLSCRDAWLQATSAEASSVYSARVAQEANNGDWTRDTRWISLAPAENPGDHYLLSLNYHGYEGGITLNAVEVIFGAQMDFSDCPLTWEILLRQEGDVQTSLGMFEGKAHCQYYSYDLGQTYTGVTQMVLRVPEADNAITNGIAVCHFGASLIPEPYTLLLALSGVGALALRRTLRQRRR